METDRLEKNVTRNQQVILGSTKRSDAGFSKGDERALASLIEAQIPAFKIETENAITHEEKKLKLRAPRGTSWEDGDFRRVTKEIVSNIGDKSFLL